MSNAPIVIAGFASIAGFTKWITPHKLTFCSVMNVTEIETPQYAANASLANILTTWRRVPNAIIVDTGFAFPAPPTKMTATITVLIVPLKNRKNRLTSAV